VRVGSFEKFWRFEVLCARVDRTIGRSGKCPGGLSTCFSFGLHSNEKLARWLCDRDMRRIGLALVS
jgi:hypothetical protein